MRSGAFFMGKIPRRVKPNSVFYFRVRAPTLEASCDIRGCAIIQTRIIESCDEAITFPGLKACGELQSIVA